MTNTTSPYEELRIQYIDRDKYGEKKLLPPVSGNYVLYVPFIGPMKVSFCDGCFYWENGEKIADSLCRWWK